MSDSDTPPVTTPLPSTNNTVGTDPKGWIPAIRDILDGTTDDILTSRILGHDWITFDAGSNTAWDPAWGSPWDYWKPMDDAHPDWNTLTIYRKIKVSVDWEYFELRRAMFNFFNPSGDLSPSKQAKKFITASTSVINDITNNATLSSASFTTASDMFTGVTDALHTAQLVMSLWMYYANAGDSSRLQGTAAEMIQWALNDLHFGFGDVRTSMLTPHSFSDLLDDVATAITTFKTALTTAWTAYVGSAYPDPNTLVKAVIDSIVDQAGTANIPDFEQTSLSDWAANWDFDFSGLSLGTYNLLSADGWSQLNTAVMTLWSGPLNTLEQAAIDATTALNTAMDKLWSAMGRGVPAPAHIPPPGAPNPNDSNIPGANPPNIDTGANPPNIDTGANGPNTGGLGPGGVDTGGLGTGGPGPGGVDTAGLGPGGLDTGGGAGTGGLGPGGLGTGALSTGDIGGGPGGLGTGGLGPGGSGALSGLGDGGLGTGGVGTGALGSGDLGGLGSGGVGTGALGTGDLGTGGLGTGGVGTGGVGTSGLGTGSGLGDLGSVGSGALGGGLLGSGAGTGGSGLGGTGSRLGTGLGTGGSGSTGDGSRSIGGLSSGGATDGGLGDGLGGLVQPGQISTGGLAADGLVNGPGSIVGPLGSTPAGYSPQGAFADLFGPEGQQFAQALAAQGTSPSGLDAATTAGLGSSGMPYMPPMGGMGGGGTGGQEKERERTTWLAEDESVWGLHAEVGAAVVGADEAEPEDDHERPTRRPTPRPARTPTVPVQPRTTR